MILQLERDILNKYNYTFKDFEDDDARNLFDLNDSFITHINVVNKYFAEPIQYKIKEDLEIFNEVRDEFYSIHERLCELTGKNIDIFMFDKLIVNLLKETK